MKTIKMTVELMTNDKGNEVLGVAGYSPDAINPDLLEKIMREVRGMGERLSKPNEEKSRCTCCQCECDEDEIEEEEECPCESCIEPDCAGCEWETCPECGGELRIMGIGRRHTLVQCEWCDWETVR